MFALLFYSCPTIAGTTVAIELFSSNNREKINMQAAFQKLVGKEQEELRNKIHILAVKNRLGKWHFEDILGVYLTEADKRITADNAVGLMIQASESFTDHQGFFIAQELANYLKQESVAVFIPCSQPSIGRITLNFVSLQPTISEALILIQNKLPSIYNLSFSLHLLNHLNNFDNTQVKAIEWLGSKIDIDEVKKAFPCEKISYQRGKAFLIYKDGHREKL